MASAGSGTDDGPLGDGHLRYQHISSWWFDLPLLYNHDSLIHNFLRPKQFLRQVQTVETESYVCLPKGTIHFPVRGFTWEVQTVLSVLL